MYVPGNDLKKIDKALGLEVDCVTLDCEDGVALNKKVNIFKFTIIQNLKQNIAGRSS